MILAQAKAIAETIVAELAPHSEKIEIAGSIRREKPEVKDIEIVCIPKQAAEFSLFREKAIGVNNPSPEWVAALKKHRIVKGNPGGRYLKLKLREIDVDLFIAFPQNWGWIYTIRTGSSSFNKRTLVRAMKATNHAAKSGFIYDSEENLINVSTESQLFNMFELTYVEPNER